jgi:hypothetical protein
MSLLLSIFCGSSQAADIWVDPDGSNISGDGSYSNPYKTISYVMDPQNNIVQDGDVIKLKAGKTYASENANPSGEEIFPIYWQPNVSIVGEDDEDPSIILGKMTDLVSWECILRPYHSSFPNEPGNWDIDSDPAKTQLKNLIFRYGGCHLCVRFAPVGEIEKDWGMNAYIENVSFEKSSHAPLNTNVKKNDTCRVCRVTYICKNCTFSDVYFSCHFEHQGGYSTQFSEKPELRACFENCIFGYKDGIPAFNGTGGLWSGGTYPGDPSSAYWGSHICVTAVADMDIVVKDCKFFGIDEIIKSNPSGGGRHHHKYAIAAELPTFSGGWPVINLNSDLAICLLSSDPQSEKQTVIEK